MAITQLSIINSARVKAGEQVITTLDSPDDATRAALAVYEDIVLEEFETGEWAFSERIATPALNDTDFTRDLAYQYLIPDDSLGLIGVRYRDQPLEGSLFRIEGDSVWTAFNSGITLIHKHRRGEASWPRRFSNIIVDRVAAVFMQATERHSEAQAVRQEAAVLAKIARHAESRQRHNRPMGEGSIVNRRRGGSIYPVTNLPGIGGGFSSAVTTTTDNTGTTSQVYTDVDYAVLAHVDFVGMDCTGGTRTITFDASNDTLESEVMFQQALADGTPSAAGAFDVHDGTAVIWTENSSRPIRFKRINNRLVGPY